MQTARIGETAVIFTSGRTGEDESGYRAAAQAMDALAAVQPGYRGMTSIRDGDGVGITVSYWVDDAAARAWRDHPDHQAIREAGRGRWYCWYRIEVATITRGYDWTRE
jgi:heme-degrading monooxygenase HmoA